ncbi:MAG: RagB/SusD family nutrient uptake outer membrane protein, partial [Phocaeicola sp.]|nr:RagB/SusD family nutrient uptake outer membrane protein [Phocaeicola sp.]
DEWRREFYFEGRRRMDLIRFNRYGGNNNYTWQWKGGAYEGRSFDAHLNIFAIPTNELTANSNLVQNPGY